MYEPNAAHEIKSIVRFAGLAFGLATLAVVILAFFVPFNVTLDARLLQQNGTLRLRQSTGREFDLQRGRNTPLEVGTRLNLVGEGSAQVEILENSAAYVYLNQGGVWGLAEAERRGTAWQHITSSPRRYTVIVAQEAGVAVYDLSRASPDLETMNLIIRLPDGEHRPGTPCFQASAPQEGRAGSVVEIPCFGQDAPSPIPTPLSLP
jgi:hypothetical protein